MIERAKKSIGDFLFGEESILDVIFRKPPKKPDARMFFLGGCGLITMIRGFYLFFGRPPQAEIFDQLGPWFINFWGCVWVFLGFAVMLVAGSGHWRSELDRAAAFLMLGLWWVWGLLYLISACIPGNPDPTADLLQACLLAVTGTVLTAGIIQGIRKTQEIRLKELAVAQIQQITAEALIISRENARLRAELDSVESKSGE